MTSEKPPKVALGIAWYRPKQWKELKAYCEDREAMDGSYEDWKRGATRALKQLRRSGEQPQKVDFDLSEFQKWCTTHKKRPNASSRSEFTAYRLQELHKSNSDA